MRVTIQSGTVTVGLTGDSLEEFVEGLAGPCDWADQVNRLVGGGEIRVSDRGNVANTLGFRVGRTHATPQAAGLYYLDHPGTVPHVGSIQFIILALDGTVAASRSMGNASVKVERESWGGCRTVMRYHITGGLITS